MKSKTFNKDIEYYKKLLKDNKPYLIIEKNIEELYKYSHTIGFNSEIKKRILSTIYLLD